MDRLQLSAVVQTKRIGRRHANKFRLDVSREPQSSGFCFVNDDAPQNNHFGGFLFLRQHFKFPF
ncbi:hypothetical protein HKD37_07G020554 [Glycine soja]